MRTLAFVLAVLCSATLSAAKAPVVTSTADLPAGSTEWKGTLADGKQFEMKWVEGTLSVKDSEDGQVHVAIEYTAAEGLPRLVLLEHGDGITLCALYADTPGLCQPGDRGAFYRGFGKKSAKTNLVISVPPAVKFAGRGWRGNADVTLTGDALVDIMFGEILIVSARNIDAKTLEGKIETTILPSPDRRKYHLNSTNSSVIAKIDGAAARVKAKAQRGQFYGNLELKTTLEYGTMIEAEGSAPGEGAVIDLELRTTNGDVRVGRRKGK